jgi:hypothetical protein
LLFIDKVPSFALVYAPSLKMNVNAVLEGTLAGGLFNDNPA